MVWTVFACFGCTKKRKRPKTRRLKRIQESDIHKNHDVTESLKMPREKPMDEKKARIRKKVRFNLNVVTYEPLSSEEEDLDTKEQAAAEAGIFLISKYRYNHCYDGEDEFDEDDDEEDECQFSDDEDDVHYQDSVENFPNVYDQEITEDLENSSSKPLISSEANARCRRHYIVPVLNPIENLSQWKAIKTRKR